MDPEEKEEFEELLEFRDDSAGGLMDTGYLSLPEQATVADAMAELKKQEDVLEDLHTIFLTDEQERLTYSVPLAKLLFAAGDTPLNELASDTLLFAHVKDKADRVAEMFDKYNLLTLPVLDHDNKLVGVITVDDVVALLRNT
jgi:magnesium transporter